MRRTPRPLQRLIGLRRGRHAYDYLECWSVLTRRMSLARDTDELGAALAEVVAAAAGATSTAVYLASALRGAFRLSASVGAARFVTAFDEASTLAAWLRRSPTPASLPAGMAASIASPPPPAALAVPVRRCGTLLGVIVLGPPRARADYTAEDLRFLATAADQAAASVLAVGVSEAGVAARQAEAVAMAHDLKNSVSALSLLARNAAANDADPLFQRDTMVTLARTVERMQRVLARLASLDDAPPRPGPEPVDLRELVLEATGALAQGGRVALVRRLQPVPCVQGDRDALLRVVENLTTNAVEAIGREGTVTVTLTQEAGYAVLSVADTGCGMSEEYRASHLFTPLHSTKAHGWGVGLHQAKQAVERHAGEISVESAEGEGTIVTVRLPLRVGAEAPVLETVR